MAQISNIDDDPYRLFARFYDLEFSRFGDDLAMYRHFALEANGPILELGCGSGRVLAALVATDLPITGIDTSPAMLDIARNRFGERVHLILADMRDVDTLTLPSAPFWMAFSAINSFTHLPDAPAQRATLRALRSVVVPGGILILDLFVPDPTYLASLDGSVAHEFSTALPNGDRVDKWVVRTHDLAGQSIETRVSYDIISAADSSVRRYSDTYLTRYLHRFELEYLLEISGWRTISVFGTYDLDPFDASTERMIFLATWGEEHLIEQR